MGKHRVNADSGYVPDALCKRCRHRRHDGYGCIATERVTQRRCECNGERAGAPR
jgi:hypothetical protein